MALESGIKEQLQSYIEQLHAIFTKKHGFRFNHKHTTMSSEKYIDAIDIRYWTAQMADKQYFMFQTMKNQNKLRVPFRPLVPNTAA